MDRIDAIIRESFISCRVCGSYEALAWGKVCDGLIDFTGGIEELIWLRRPDEPEKLKEEIKRVIREACIKKSMIGCCIMPETEQSAEGLLWNGLVTGNP